ncbi:MAG: biopolymer transporter ExbD [Alphaproteobacteria bacterium]|nr:biopolymer transporter ExbD [Alphaproteobacteria bacterium]
MSMNVGPASGEGDVMVEMNTTPLIDVMLVLLTLLIITLPIQTHAVKLDMPAPSSNPPTVIPENAATKDPQPEIHINPNRLAKYDAVAKVLADAQRLGATHIGFTGIDQYN